MIAEIQQGALSVLNYVGAGWDYLCGGLQGVGSFLGGMTMKVFGA